MSVTADVRILVPGLLTTLQDGGRARSGAFGVARAGFADWWSAGVANALVGNARDAPLIETTLTGVLFAVTRPVHIAVSGADADVTVNDHAVLLWQTIALRAGDRVEVRAARAGVRNYVAFAGGIRGRRVLGSASTDVTAGFGGLEGRPLGAGDSLTLERAGESEPPQTRHVPSGQLPTWRNDAVLRVVTGPHAGNLADANQMLGAAFSLTPQCNRQGVRLRGNAIVGKRSWDALSFGVTDGCVQISNDGQPIILLCEHQTTGGYGVPYVVISADVPVVAQLRPGDRVTLQAVNQADAAKALTERIRLSRVRATDKREA
ncbi:MAG TPA: biotin-dependent carboxyltransferase family protein [Candidatus Eremiobacteraceae bacterium]|nr:biotin-dependent carboxyltransferase family protein [Candidatus Eremiobacteraceae bacterium]